MEIQSFILGVFSVVVAVISVVAVVGFFKVNNLEKKLTSIEKDNDMNFSNTHREMHSQIEHIRSLIETSNRDIYSTIDSRLDKLESKITKDKTTKKELLHS